MNPHTIRVLEYDKILNKLATFCAFGGGEELATSLLPSDDLRTISEWMEQTDEACRLLDQKTDIYFGGVYDVRHLTAKSERGSILIPTELVEVRTTLMRARTLRNTLTRLNRQFPRLADIAFAIEPCEHVIGEISRCINGPRRSSGQRLRGVGPNQGAAARRPGPAPQHAGPAGAEH